MKNKLSPKINAIIEDDEEVIWCKNTNVIPQVIGQIPGTLLFGGFMGIWSGMFFGIPAMTIFQTIKIPIMIGVVAFIIPMILLIIRNIYEAKNEQFVVTEKNLITLKANKLNVNTTRYNRSDIKEISVNQSFISDIMGVGNICFEVYQTDMDTDTVVFEGINNPYNEVSKLKEILSKDLNKNN